MAYQERLDEFLELHAADLDTDRKKVSALITVIGSKAYSRLRDLSSPQLPSKRTYAELTKLLKEFYAPKTLVIAERFNFGKRDQREGESAAEYLAELRRLAETCDYGAQLEEQLRDRFVVGLSNGTAQKQLLTIANLTLKRALEVVQGIEVAEKQVNSFQTSRTKDAAVNRLHNGSKTCWRCLSLDHNARDCRFKSYECDFCGRVGHLRRACTRKDANKAVSSKPSPQSQLKKKGGSGSGKSKTGTGPNQNPRVNHVVPHREDVHLPMFRAADDLKAVPPLLKTLVINGVSVEMEVDTGAAVTILPHHLMCKLGVHSLDSVSTRLTTCSGHQLQIRGSADVDVHVDGRRLRLPAVFVDASVPPLLGRNWLQSLDSGWTKSLEIKSVEVTGKLNSLLRECEELFRDELGCFKGVEVELRLKSDAKPIFLKSRKVPYSMTQLIQDQLDDLLRRDVIEPVTTSEWATPTVNIPKGNGEVRICGDYKLTINPQLEVEQYPLPTAQELFSTLNGGQKFSKLDLRHAYEQLLLSEGSRAYVTIHTHRGLYRYKRLPYGVASAPAVFQKHMESLLRDIPGVCVFLDDILVTARDDATHLERLREVMKRLIDNGLKVSRRKCSFLQNEVEYLGHVISGSGVSTNPEKIRAVKEAPAPTNVEELRSFLGLVNFYARFVPDLATAAKPLTLRLRSDYKWDWNQECKAAFVELKKKLTTSPVLAHYDPSLPLQLSCDASPVGVGAVLAHVDTDGTERPIAYASRTLSRAEENYAQLEREALAIVFGVKRFHDYIYGREFTLVTDNKPLALILGPKNGIPTIAAARLQRWAVILSAYQYEVLCKRSEDNANADALSRLPLKTDSSDMADVAATFNVLQLERCPVNAESLREAGKQDPVYSSAVQHTLSGWTEETEDDLQPYFKRKWELSVQDGCLLWGRRVVIPSSCRKRVLDELHAGHSGIVKMKAVARLHVWWPSIDHDIEERARGCALCQQLQKLPAAVSGQWPVPSAAWERLHVDFAGPFMGAMFLVIVDDFSKWLEVEIMQSTTATNVIEVLRKIFATHGLPRKMVSDNGPPFHSADFEEFLSTNGVQHIFSAPYHPPTNGAAERAVQTLKLGLRKQTGGSLQAKLSRFLLSYRTTPHGTTGCAPSELLYGRRLRTRLDLLRPDDKLTTERKKDETHQSEKKIRIFHPGQRVRVRAYSGQRRFWVQGIIIRRTGTLHYEVEVKSRVWKRHVNQMLPLQGDGLVSTQTEGDAGFNSEASLDEEVSGSEQTDPLPQPMDPEPNVANPDVRVPTRERRYPQRARRPVERLGL